jgi:mannose-6-phosphate isomerase-like protein (cupin superfamily)
MRTITCLFLLSAAAWSADPGVTCWTAAELKAYEKKLAPKMNEQKVATENLGRYPNSLAMVAHREGDGEAEVHETVADFFVVQSGEATLVSGGELSGGHTTQPHEIRGPSIKGGQSRKLAVGDVVHIPAGVPHQLLVSKGGQFTYFVVKVDK